MHMSSMKSMEEFVNKWVLPKFPEEFTVLDIGSMDVNGTYGTLFPTRAKYTGMDMAPGKNVTYVPKDAYSWNELEDESFDVIISGQCLEHVEYPWVTMEEVYKKLKPGGLTCQIAPSSGHEHRFPVDCYRYFPDGMIALCKWARLEVLEASYNKQNKLWGDCRVIATK